MDIQSSKRKFDDKNPTNNDLKKTKHSNISEKKIMLDISLHNGITLNIDVQEEPYGQFVSMETIYYHSYSSGDNEMNFQISPNKRF